MLKFFSSSLQPDEFVTKLKSFVDEEEIDPGSSTQFSGDRPVIGRFDTRRFTLQRRVGIHWILWWLTPGQWFKPYLNGSVTDAHSGSRIELTGGTPIPVKLLWVLILLGVSGLITVWTIFSYPYNLSHDPAHSGNDLLAGIVLLSLLSGLLVLLPIVGWLQTRFHLADIVNELQKHLDLRKE
jgi:NhaP-type Na+/H+ or K+/H+ antiporter